MLKINKSLGEKIGEATALLFAREGSKLVVADINEVQGKEVRR